MRARVRVHAHAHAHRDITPLDSNLRERFGDVERRHGTCSTSLSTTFASTLHFTLAPVAPRRDVLPLATRSAGKINVASGRATPSDGEMREAREFLSCVEYTKRL